MFNYKFLFLSVWVDYVVKTDLVHDFIVVLSISGDQTLVLQQHHTSKNMSSFPPRFKIMELHV